MISRCHFVVSGVINFPRVTSKCLFVNLVWSACFCVLSSCYQEVSLCCFCSDQPVSLGYHRVISKCLIVFYIIRYMCAILVWSARVFFVNLMWSGGIFVLFLCDKQVSLCCFWCDQHSLCYQQVSLCVFDVISRYLCAILMWAAGALLFFYVISRCLCVILVWSAGVSLQ